MTGCPRNINYLNYPADLQNELFGGYDPTKFVASSLEICVELNTGSTPLRDATLRLLWNPLGNDAATAPYLSTNTKYQYVMQDVGGQAKALDACFNDVDAPMADTYVEGDTVTGSFQAMGTDNGSPVPLSSLLGVGLGAIEGRLEVGLHLKNRAECRGDHTPDSNIDPSLHVQRRVHEALTQAVLRPSKPARGAAAAAATAGAALGAAGAAAAREPGAVRRHGEYASRSRPPTAKRTRTRQRASIM